MKHGGAKDWPRGSSPEYRTWLHIRGRCTNRTDAAYRHYGGRGIRVCKEWDDYSQFLADIGPRPSVRHTLERLDNDGDYKPGNCAWVTRKAQARNRRSTKWVEVDGKQISFAEACERAGVKYHTAYFRMLRGSSLEAALAK